jgi:hypothetical protein
MFQVMTVTLPGDGGISDAAVGCVAIVPLTKVVFIKRGNMRNSPSVSLKVFFMADEDSFQVYRWLRIIILATGCQRR